MRREYVIPKTAFVKVANIPMPDDTGQWESEIFAYLEREHGFVLPYVNTVDWEEGKYEASTGNAFGEVKGLYNNTPFRLPVIIKDYKMEPIDTILIGGRRTYFSEDSFDSLIDGLESAQPTNVATEEDRTKRLLLNTNSLAGMYSPLAGKFASDKFNTIVDSDSSLKTYLNPKLASKAKYLGEMPENFHRGGEYHAISLKEASEGVELRHYENGVLVGTKFMDKTSEEYVKSAEIVRENNGCVIKTGSTVNTSALDLFNPKKNDLTGAIEAMDSHNNMIPGRRYCTYNFEGDLVGKIFIDPKENNYSLSDSFFSKKTRRNVQANKHVKVEEIHEGDFIALETDKDKVIGPLEIKSRKGFPDGKILLVFQDRRNDLIQVLFSDEVNVMIKSHMQDDKLNPYSYLCPKSISVIKLNNQMVLADKEYQGQSAVNSQILKNFEGDHSRCIARVLRKSDDSFVLKIAEEVVENYANGNDLNAGLMSIGCGEKEASLYVQYLQTEGDDLRIAGVSHNKVASIPEDLMSEYLSGIEKNRINLIKSANWILNNSESLKKVAYLEDEDETLDNILGLSLIDGDTIKRNIDKIPALEKSVDDLADLLFNVRIGLPEVEEGAIRSAMVNLHEVVSGLRDLYVYRS